MAVIINDFEVVTEPTATNQTAPPPNGQNMQATPLKPSELERMLARREERLRRVRAY